MASTNDLAYWPVARQSQIRENHRVLGNPVKDLSIVLQLFPAISKANNNSTVVISTNSSILILSHQFFNMFEVSISLNRMLLKEFSINKNFTKRVVVDEFCEGCSSSAIQDFLVDF